ncbi:alpha/beta hydrolase [Streptomyces sp. NPDC058718]|uniref:alpha/beta hydrolase n=1 Tax=Streptomyces sp. NPDC058718 TaxID=3346610 RepID=UPI0036B28FE9
MTDLVLDGPHGPLTVRVYAPEAAAGPGLVWVHGGGFARGDLDMSEADWVARQFAERRITVVSVGYGLAPIPQRWAGRADGAARDGVHYPVASDEVEFAFRWAVESELSTGPWSLGGASAGGNLAAGAAMRLVHTGGPVPALAVLAYPTLHAVQSAPDDALRALLDAHPEADTFGPETVRAMYENYLGTPIDAAEVYAVPGTAPPEQLAGFPPAVVFPADVDELRISGEGFARALHAAGVECSVVTEPGTRHGYLNRPDEPAALATVERCAARILAAP